MEKTGRGRNAEARADAPAFSLREGFSLDEVVTMLALRSMCDCDLTALSAADLAALAYEADPDDEFLGSEVVGIGVKADLLAYVDDLHESAFGLIDALDRAEESRLGRSGHRGLTDAAVTVLASITTACRLFLGGDVVALDPRVNAPTARVLAEGFAGVTVGAAPGAGGTSAKSGGTTSGALRVTCISSGRARLNSPVDPQADRPASAARRQGTATNLRMVVTLRICVLFAQQERARKQDQHADGNRGVRKVENEERPPFAEVKIGEIDHETEAHPVYDIAERAAKDAAERKSLVGSGDRSDRIRTYNFPQGRLTDHRINLTLYKLQFIMDGDLGEVVTALRAEREAEQLAELEVGAGG